MRLPRVLMWPCFRQVAPLSLEWAPRFAEAGITVVDNSSAWRMSEEHKLVVPEVNGDVMGEEDLVIANPNCTTMQLVMCLKPLHDGWRIRRGVVNTYQSVTGTGQAAKAQLEAERRGETGNRSLSASHRPKLLAPLRHLPRKRLHP